MLITVLLTTLIWGDVTSFKLLTSHTDCNGQQVCVADTPMAVSTIDVTTSVHPHVQCAFACLSTPNCSNYNVRYAANLCELFTLWPTRYTWVPGCGHQLLMQVRPGEAGETGEGYFDRTPFVVT